MMKVLWAVRNYTHLSLASFLNSDCFAPIPELIGKLLKISVPLESKTLGNNKYTSMIFLSNQFAAQLWLQEHSVCHRIIYFEI